MTHTPTLKPCPFGCKEPLIFAALRDCVDDFDHGYVISCPSCGIEGHDEYKDDLVTAWNTRTEAIEAGAVRDAFDTMRKLRDDLAEVDSELHAQRIAVLDITLSQLAEASNG